jgi:hypothetical protein
MTTETTDARLHGLRGKILQAAIILREGGYFEEKLERNWKGREQFHTRLFDSNGYVVKGFGFAAREECIRRGLTRSRLMWRTSVHASRSVWIDTPTTQDEIDIMKAWEIDRDYN